MLLKMYSAEQKIGLKMKRDLCLFLLDWKIKLVVVIAAGFALEMHYFIHCINLRN